MLRTADGASLAYLGDCVFELWVRRRLLLSGIKGTGALNEASRRYVTAKNQCAAFHRIEGMLTEEETAYFRRGRNSPHLSVPRSASGAEYRTARNSKPFRRAVLRAAVSRKPTSTPKSTSIT